MTDVFPPFRFGNDLQISDKLFVMDTGASNSKDMKLLRNHLQELRARLISVGIDTPGAGGWGGTLHSHGFDWGSIWASALLLPFCT